MTNLLTGLVVFAASIAGLWFCLPNKDREKQKFLRGGLDTFAGIAVTAGFGFGLAMIIAGIVEH